MSTLGWLWVTGLLMSAITLIGSITLVLDDATLERWLRPLLALAAGSMLGSALFHLIPAGAAEAPIAQVMGYVAVGFVVFFGLEQLLHWHRCHRRSPSGKQALGYLILLGDGLHNFLGGLAIAGVFLVDTRAGIAAWLAAAAHEIPQELGDFAALLHAGFSKRKALLFNLLSGLTFLVGALMAYAASHRFDLRWLVPVAAGNFLYIAASDLVPEVNKPHTLRASALQFAAFAGGLGILYSLHSSIEH